MAGILSYNKYLNTLQTLSNAESSFPSTQKTLTFDIEGGGADGWTASVNYSVILVDKISWVRDIPNFTNSSVIGYFPEFEGSFTEYSTGVISIPANIYQGPILPTGEKNVPIVIINITWTKDDLTFSTNLGYVQAWEPGVPLGDPYKSIYFEPVDPIASILDLNGPDLVIYLDQITFTADSSIPIALGANNPCYFYANTGTGADILLGESFFDDHRASITLPTENVLTTGTWFIFAEFRGIEQYGKTTSNTLELEVVPGIPLIRDTESFNPDKELYFPGDQSIYSIRVIPDPSFEPTGVEVANTMTLALVNEFPPNTATTFFSGNFVDGEASGTFTIDASMINTAIDYAGTEWTVQSYSTSTGQYVAQVLVTNDQTVRTSWGFQTIGRYAAGSTSTLITVANTATITLPINNFELVVFSEEESVVWNTPWPVSIFTIETGYSQDITLTAVKDEESVILFQGNQTGSSPIEVSTDVLGTGTWVVSATYPGDFGDDVRWANAPSTSNSIEVRIRAGNELFPSPVFTYWTSGTTDYLRVWASTSTTLTNVVSFYDGSTLLGTGEWIRRANLETTQTVWYQGGEISPGMPSMVFRNDTQPQPTGQQDFTESGSWNFGAANAPAGNLTTLSDDIRLTYPIFDFRTSSIISGSITPTWETDIPAISYDYYTRRLPEYALFLGSLHAKADGIVNPNRFRLWKYYDGTNYDMSAGTNTDITTLLDPITTGSWTVNKLESISGTELAAGGNGRFDPEYIKTNYPYETNYQFDVYDIYRTDDIGDYRGYNVIGIEIEDDGVALPDVSEENPYTVYFRPSTRQYLGNEGTRAIYSGAPLAVAGLPRVPVTTRTGFTYLSEGDYVISAEGQFVSDSIGVYGRTRSIELVEFIGEVHWPKPIYNNEQAAGTEARPMNKIWLFRFTPEVRQSNTQFNTFRPFVEHLQYLPPNEYHPDGKYKTIPVSNNGIWRAKDGTYRELSFRNWPRRNQDFAYGLKYWQSRNTADLSENLYTDFCSSWYLSFGIHCFDPRGPQWSNRSGVGNQSYSTASIATVYTTTSLVSYDIQTVDLELPLGTITSIDNLHAVWSGTLDLGPEYGKFLGFDIGITENPFDIEVELVDKGAPGVLIGETPSPAITNNYSNYSTSTGVIYSTNPAGLRATRLPVDTTKYPVEIGEGTFEFYDVNTNTLLGSVTTTTNSAIIPITAADLTNTLGVSNRLVRATFKQTGTTNPAVSPSRNIQIINFAGYNNFTFDFTSNNYLRDSVSYNPRPINLANNLRTLSNKSFILLGNYNKSSFGISSGPVLANGSINVLFPRTNRLENQWRYAGFGGAPTAYHTWYKAYFDQTLVFVETFYRLNNTGPYYPFGTKNVSGNDRYFEVSERILQSISNNSTAPLAVSDTFNNEPIGIDFSGTWTSIQIYMSISAYAKNLDLNSEIRRATPEGSDLNPLWSYGSGAAITPDSVGGYNHTITLSTST
jgi:hypothetical protein